VPTWLRPTAITVTVASYSVDMVDEPGSEQQQDGIGGPDGLERLWTPYRMAYLRGENKPADHTEGECPFCRIP
jgi:hypothetical protein